MDPNSKWNSSGIRRNLFNLPDYRNKITTIDKFDLVRDITFHWQKIYIDADNIVLKYDVTSTDGEALIIEYAALESENQLLMSNSFDCQILPKVEKTIAFSYLPFPDEVSISIFRLKVLDENTTAEYKYTDDFFLHTQPKIPHKFSAKEEKDHVKEVIYQLLGAVKQMEEQYIPGVKSLDLNISFQLPLNI